MICEICGTKFEKTTVGRRVLTVLFRTLLYNKVLGRHLQRKGKHIVIDGVCYAVADGSVNGFWGMVVQNLRLKCSIPEKLSKLNNLWCQGDVPEEYKPRLPNTAEFVR